MFIWLTSPTIGQVLVNLNLVTAVTCVQGRNAVCFTGGEEDYIVVTESLGGHLRADSVRRKEVQKMTIPEKLKIGAKVYDVEITNKLDLGNVNYSGEISYTDLVIRICPNAQAKMEADFLHEMVHGMLDHLGYTEHDEKKVDELANVLHMVILDNPTVFTPVKEGQHENVCNTESEDR